MGGEGDLSVIILDPFEVLAEPCWESAATRTMNDTPTPSLLACFRLPFFSLFLLWLLPFVILSHFDFWVITRSALLHIGTVWATIRAYYRLGVL